MSDSEWEIVARLVAGELPDSEAAAFRSRIEADPKLSALVHALVSAPLGADASVTPDVEAALRRVRDRMRAESAPAIPFRQRTPATRSPWLIPIAATLLIAAGGGWLMRPKATPVTVASNAAPKVHRTTVGSRATISLDDGSRVVLGPGSELTVGADFPRVREVALKGQAHFSVVHDASNEFIVRTSEGVITDLGTEFTVNDYDGVAIDVAVQSGSVSVRSSRGTDSSVVLKAGDMASVDPRGVLTRSANAASADDFAWTSGRLVFRESPMIKVRAELRRWYGVELVTQDSALAASHLNTSFGNETRQQVVDIIAMSLGAKAEVHGDTVVLSPRRSTAR